MDFSQFDHLQNPIIVADSSGKISYHNFVCSLFFKMPPRKLKAITKITDLIKVENYLLIDELSHSREKNIPIVSPEVKIDISGIKYTVILKIIPAGEFHIIHVQDFSIEKKLHEKYKQQIIELKQTHDQIVKSDKITALGELIAGISHEISSPLTVASDKLLSITENLHLKEYKFVGVDLRDLQEEFSRIKQIVSNMQSMAKNKEEDLLVMDIRDVIKQSLAFVEDLGIMNDVEVTLNLTECFALGNDGKLQQVLINLIKNSIDALKNIDKKRIVISLESSSQIVKINVEDNGDGIKKPGEIFEMFYTTKEYGEGTGLGLSISQKIMESFHGQILCLPNKGGANFQLELPKLDLECFTSTNRYLLGECEYEDPKVIVYASKASELDHVYQSLKEQEVVLILTNEIDNFEDLCDSYMVDFAFSFDKQVKTDEFNFFKLSSDNMKDAIKIIKEKVS